MAPESVKAARQRSAPLVRPAGRSPRARLYQHLDLVARWIALSVGAAVVVLFVATVILVSHGAWWVLAVGERALHRHEVAAVAAVLLIAVNAVWVRPRA